MDEAVANGAGEALTGAFCVTARFEPADTGVTADEGTIVFAMESLSAAAGIVAVMGATFISDAACRSVSEGADGSLVVSEGL